MLIFKIFYFLKLTVSFLFFLHHPQVDNTKKSNDIKAANTLIKEKEKCGTFEYMQNLYEKDPTAKERMYELELKIQKTINNQRIPFSFKKATKIAIIPVPVIIIPVVVNVVYCEKTEKENITCTQIMSQITALNRDFNPPSLPPSFYFANKFGKMKIKFALKKVFRHKSKVCIWDNNDDVKQTSKDGQDAYMPNQMLNIWVANLVPGLYGFANYPVVSVAMDGVVISPYAFGTAGIVRPTNNLGKVATHEIGHWLNLIHIWGDGGHCSDDFVNDTPTQFDANRGTPNYPTLSGSCSPKPSDMFMNYMDYTDDRAQYMFSKDQVLRSRALFNAIPAMPRNKFITSSPISKCLN
jgi:Pregnancy-associated plasma protein-A